jgi:hypothetical protein
MFSCCTEAAPDEDEDGDEDDVLFVCGLLVAHPASATTAAKLTPAAIEYAFFLPVIKLPPELTNPLISQHLVY